MRILTNVLVAGLLACAPAFAETNSDTQAQAVETLVSSTPNTDGSHTLTLALKDGSRLTLQIPGQEGVKFISALSTPTGQGQQQVAVFVQKLSIGVDDKGSTLLLLPIGAGGPLEPLAFPVSGAENFIRLFQEKLGEARARAAAQSKPK